MSCGGSTSQTFKRLNATTPIFAYEWYTGWMSCVGLDTIMATVVGRACSSDDIECQVAQQVAKVRTDDPDPPTLLGSVLSPTSGVLDSNSTVLDISGATEPAAFVRWGLAYRYASGQSQSSGDLGLDVAYLRCGELVGAGSWQLDSSTTAMRYIPITDWLVRLLVDEVKLISLLTNLTGPLQYRLVYRTVATDGEPQLLGQRYRHQRALRCRGRQHRRPRHLAGREHVGSVRDRLPAQHWRPRARYHLCRRRHSPGIGSTMNGAPSPIMPQPMVGTPTTQQGLDPGRRLVWETFNAVLREELEHQRPVALRPIEVMEALYAPPAAQVGRRQTLLRFQGPPMEQPGVRPGSTVDPAGFVLDVSRPSGDEGAPPQKQVEYADGTSSTWRNDGVAIGERHWRGPVLYEYLGQVRRGQANARGGGHRWIDAFEGYVDNSPRGQIMGSHWFDAKGGEWLAVDFDGRALALKLAEYDRAMRLATGIDEDPAEEGSEWVEEEGGVGILSSHTRYECDGTEYWRFGFDDRERQTTLTERQKASALLPDGVCGGVWVDSDSVLTAAHCVGDWKEKVLYDKSAVDVCTQGNAYSDAACMDGDLVEPDVFVPAKWWKDKNDIAVVNHGYRYSVDSSHTRMWLSRATDKVLREYQMHNIAHPRHAPLCASNVATAISSVHDSARFLTHAMGPISTRSHHGTHRWEIDGGKGHSGSPIYYCGDERCDTGDSGLVVSIWSTRRPSIHKAVGPKVRTFRSWIVALT